MAKEGDTVLVCFNGYRDEVPRKATIIKVFNSGNNYAVFGIGKSGQEYVQSIRPHQIVLIGSNEEQNIWE